MENNNCKNHQTVLTVSIMQENLQVSTSLTRQDSLTTEKTTTNSAS